MTIGCVAVASHNRLQLLLGLVVMICESMSGKRIQRGAWALFSIPVHQQIFENYCSSAWESWQ